MFAPFSSLVSRQPQSCPVELLAKNLAMRGPRPGALFITVDGAPVCRSHFSNKLSSDIHFCGLSPQFTKGTVFELVLLLMLQIWGYPMLKSAF